MEKTFVIIKPDAVRARLVGSIIRLYEQDGLSIEQMDLRSIDGAFADQHYAEHVERDFYPPLREFMTSGPLVAMVLSGDDAVAKVREINGATDPAQAAPGTVRAFWGTSVRENCVHGSDGAESAEREIGLWFPNLR